MAPILFVKTAKNNSLRSGPEHFYRSDAAAKNTLLDSAGCSMRHFLGFNYLALYAFHKRIERHGAKVTFAVLAYGNDVVLRFLFPYY